MRDIAVIAIVFGSIPFILRRPHIGVLMWVWLSVMNPHRLTWGVAHDFGFASVIGTVTLVSALLSRDLRRPPLNGVTVALVLFVVWTSVTTVFAFYPDDAYEKWTTMMKTQAIVFLIPMLFHRKEHLRVLLWVLVLSIAYYGTKGGLFTLVTGGNFRVWGPEGSYIEDNNALAVAIVMMIPFMRYLQLTTSHRYVRWGLTGMMLLCGVSALGSYSRGALLAAATMVAFLCWKSKHKLPVLLVAALAIPLVLNFMPDKWFARMDTITTYEQDRSANMRLNAWGTMFNIAKDRPLVGGGFEVATRQVYDRYSPDPGFPPQVAHSIYFQALGEHGFVGLFLFLWLYFALWRHAGAVVRLARGRPELAWAQHFGLMLQVSVMGFAVGGAFLSLVNHDVPYYVIGCMLVVRALVDRELAAAGEKPRTRPTAAQIAGAWRAGESRAPG